LIVSSDRRGYHLTARLVSCLFSHINLAPREGGLNQVLRYCRWPNQQDIETGSGPLLITKLSTVPKHYTVKVLSTEYDGDDDYDEESTAKALTSQPNPNNRIDERTEPLRSNAEEIKTKSNKDETMPDCDEYALPCIPVVESLTEAKESDNCNLNQRSFDREMNNLNEDMKSKVFFNESQNDPEMKIKSIENELICQFCGGKKEFEFQVKVVFIVIM
jgi:hypothetical protein